MNNSYKNITTPATTTFYGGEIAKCVLRGIAINKPLAGTLTINAGSTAIGILAAGTIAGMYWHSEKGVEIESLNIVNASTENVTVFYSNI